MQKEQHCADYQNYVNQATGNVKGKESQQPQYD